MKLIDATRSSTASTGTRWTCAEFGFRQRRKQAGPFESAFPIERRVPRSGALEGLDDPRELAHPRCGMVAGIPKQAKPSAGAEHAVNLGQCLLAPKPVKRLGRHDGVGTPVGKRDGFGRSVDAREPRQFLNSLSRIAPTGSTAIISGPRGEQAFVNLPVPAPNSMTRAPGLIARAATRCSTAAGG